MYKCWNLSLELEQEGYFMVCDGYHGHQLTNEERYEGYMRSDFRGFKKVPYNVRIVKLKEGTNVSWCS